MEDYRKKTDEMEKDVVFSHAIKAGKRIYYMDVRKTRKNDLYLSITESKKIVDGDGPDAQVSFEKHKVFLYKEDFGSFIDGLTKTMRFIHESEKAQADQSSTPQDNPSGSHEFEIEF